jgi:hypothetical protein
LPTKSKLKLTILEFANKSNFNRGANFFGICQQKQFQLTVFCLSRAEKTFRICQQKQLQLTVLLDAQRNFWNLPSKATQIDCKWFSRAAKTFGICQQK